MIPAKVPSRERVREFECVRCGAQPGEPCRDNVDGAMVARSSNHRERVEACQRWLGRQLPLENGEAA